MATEGAGLKKLARLYGVDTAYQDAAGKRRQASPESVFRTLQILGAPVTGPEDIAAAIRRRVEAPWRRGIEPVVIAWNGRLRKAVLRLPDRQVGRVRGVLQLESGESLTQEWNAATLPTEQTISLDGDWHSAKRLNWPGRLPTGCHRLTIELDGELRESLVISALAKAYVPENSPGAGRCVDGRSWGVFLPLYALRSRTSWGAGDFGDLGRLLDWVHGRGGGVVATLPLLAAFLDEPYEPSPYSPVSRLFWNEFYLDVAKLPELRQCAAAQEMLGSTPLVAEIEALRAMQLVDYRRQMALKRKVLAELARFFFATPTTGRGEFERFLAAHPRADDYARFRAAGERLRRPWPEWPAVQRGGSLAAGDFDDEVRQYHLYVQWRAEGQLAALAADARRSGPGLYLDLPLGVHGCGYDVWRERNSFATEASGGCPPDIVFPNGQDWGFPPLHPERIRTEGYGYVRAYLQHQVKYAGILRIDHMPVFHRLWWVPQGTSARDGVYVRYPAEELYALFNLESHRYRTMLVGEDLGTVPPEVPKSMARHGVHHMYVLQYSLTPDAEATLPDPPAASVASLNTHDMPPLAAFVEGTDVGERDALCLSGGADPAQELEKRRKLVELLRGFLEKADGTPIPDDDAGLLQACERFLAQSDARVMLVNLEDLWAEKSSQNIPSTGDRHPNWRRKARYSLEELDELPAVGKLLEAVAELRGQSAAAGATMFDPDGVAEQTGPGPTGHHA